MTASTRSSSLRAARSREAAPKDARPARPVACIRSLPALAPPSAAPAPSPQLAPPALPAGRVARWVVATTVTLALVATLAVVGTLVAVGGVGWTGQGTSPEIPAETAVIRVGAGETVWDVARRVAPQSDPHAVVDRIRQLNGIAGSAVQPGQQLQVPVGR